MQLLKAMCAYLLKELCRTLIVLYRQPLMFDKRFRILKNVRGSPFCKETNFRWVNTDQPVHSAITHHPWSGASRLVKIQPIFLEKDVPAEALCLSCLCFVHFLPAPPKLLVSGQRNILRSYRQALVLEVRFSTPIIPPLQSSDITWTDSAGRPVSDRDRTNTLISTSANASQLRFTGVLPEDRDNFTCTARTISGIDSVTFVVTVEGETCDAAGLDHQAIYRLTVGGRQTSYFMQTETSSSTVILEIFVSD